MKEQNESNYILTFHLKYQPLYEYLTKTSDTSVVLTLDEINKILFPATLPKSAYKYRAWWANDNTHVQASAWMSASFRSTKFNDNSVTFEKQESY